MDNRNVFGSFLMKEVRDKAIKRMLRILSGQYKAPITRDIQNELSEMTDSEKELIKKFIVESIDNCLFTLLVNLDEHEEEFRISIETDEVKCSLQDGSGDLEEMFYFWRDDYAEIKNEFYNAV